MFTEHDAKFLDRALRHNRCILFVGAGFSRGAMNRRGEAMPSGEELARILWDWLFDEKYDGTGLAEVYQAALDSGRELRSLKYLLEEHLLAQDVPDWYLTLSRPYWYRIYGTNVDDVVEHAYTDASGATPVSVVKAPHEEYDDRDQFLRSIQYIKLNGSLPDDPRRLTFAIRQYAERLATYDTWYHHFVRDYVLHPTVFVGTQLDEPIFWQAIASRQRRGQYAEERPRSFLVSPAISAAKLPVLKQLNVKYIRGTAEMLANWLAEHYRFPSRSDVLRLIAPEEASVISGAQSIAHRDAIIELVSIFPRVPTTGSSGHHTKDFYLGTPPSWADVLADFDAPREITSMMVASVKQALKKPEISVIGLIGSGGSGKSTTMKRAAMYFRQSGREVLFTEGVRRPIVDSVIDGLQAIGDRAIVFIDNAHLLGPVFGQILKALGRLRRPPVVVFATRSALLERDIPEVIEDPNVVIHDVPDLSESDIGNLLNTLERERQLGVLEPLPLRKRIRAFKVRARKQILVAMREATQGRGFDDIMRSEYSEIASEEARVLYLCAALGTTELIDISVGQWLACAEVAPSTALGFLAGPLRGLVLRVTNGKRVAPRHAVIAEFIVDNVADRGDLAKAYRRVLAALSHDIYRGQGRRGRSWRLFVRVINHRRIYERFSDDITKAREIYNSIGDWFRRDGHYWLQYANLEIEYGALTYARPHLAHAEALMPRSHQVQTSAAHLIMKESLSAASYDEALRMRRERCDILLDQMSQSTGDEYPHHVYLTQNLAWIERWESDRTRRIAAMEELKEMAGRACDRYRQSRRLRFVRDRIAHKYLELGLPNRRW